MLGYGISWYSFDSFSTNMLLTFLQFENFEKSGVIVYFHLTPFQTGNEWY